MDPAIDEIYEAHKPKDPSVHGHRYKLTFQARGFFGSAWKSEDIATGEVRFWAPEDFVAVLTRVN